ncbi:asparagine synthase (glutamine-hydrolyzing) [Alteribacillus sp. HJP-4]|uniref:asparagine synthase (glutamine-hydrolyzing) n=1 Tax=Alteribacillus sp. HJP-4 TaxID=2775394 RepID=UPI0035CCE918
MCGITGWLSYDKNMERERKTVESMTNTLSYRGPDQQGFYGEKHIAFGHTRLIVIDPDGGKQPMIKQHGSNKYALVYNGELYNTEALRRQLLKKGHTFSSHSDTEVLLTAYIEWGPMCVENLNGIFAFAVWDEERETLFLARDRLGVKPLFYTCPDREFLFGSEIKALLANDKVKAVIDEQGVAELFSLGPSRVPGSAVFAGINELKPAHCMTITRTGRRENRYWDVKNYRHEETLDESVKQIHKLLSEAASRQLISDVPISTFLSGGVDSSALTAFAAKESNYSLRTFSIDYEENDKHFKANNFQPDSDRKYIDQMIKKAGTRHEYCVISIEDLIDGLEEAVVARDLPGMADIDSSLLWFCREIKKHAVVALSGECADEVFGGYPWFYREELLNRSGFPWMDSILERQKLLHKNWGKNIQLKSFMINKYNDTIAQTPLSSSDSEAQRKHKQMVYLNMHWFMSTLLERKDRMSMRASLEVRVPFADHHLVEYMWNIPGEWKQLDGKEKGILRKALEGVLPNDVLYRKKNPYPKTHHPKYTELIAQKLETEVMQKDAPVFELLDRKRVKDLIDSKGASMPLPWFGQLMTGPQLLAYIYQVNVWLKKYNITVK